MRSNFVSGHLDLTEDEFQLHYKPLIDEACLRGDAFVVGDAAGADNMAQQYLSDKNYQHVIVFHMFDSPRHNAGKFPTRGGFQTDSERDEQMTKGSTHDILWVRSGREKSGTAKNAKRRIKSMKDFK